MIFRTIGGVKIPALGLGTFGLTGSECERAVRAAIDMGYRHIDTAPRYGNEVEVGRGMRASGVSREQLFVTSKVWPTDLARAAAIASAESSLKNLELDYVDLLLVHWPNPEVKLAETFGAFSELQKRGLTKLIGVSNFPTALLHETLDVLHVPAVANQVEYHPFIDQTKVLNVLRKHGMILTAYIPLARGKVNDDPTLLRIGRERRRSAAQIALRWLVEQDDVAAIPRSSRVERLRENFSIFDFSLTPAETAAINALRTPTHIANPSWGPVWDTA
jgi:2,5-diketo-D-gluconate reductase B